MEKLKAKTNIYSKTTGEKIKTYGNITINGDNFSFFDDDGSKITYAPKCLTVIKPEYCLTLSTEEKSSLELNANGHFLNVEACCNALEIIHNNNAILIKTDYYLDTGTKEHHRLLIKIQYYA